MTAVQPGKGEEGSDGWTGGPSKSINIRRGKLQAETLMDPAPGGWAVYRGTDGGWR